MLDKPELDSAKTACDATLSRKEFLTKLVQRAAVAGSLIAAPKVIDKFLVPPAQAINSTTTVHDTTSSQDNTQHFKDSHAPFRPPNTHGNSHGGNTHGNTHGNVHGNGDDNTESVNNSSSSQKDRKFDPDSGWY